MLFSIVIPTYNRLPILRKCLAALEAQQGMEPGDQFEIVLVDDGSTDETVPWLHANKALLPHLRLVCQDHGGPALGRNLGVAEAKGEVIVFIDSDLVVLPSFLAEHGRALRRSWQRQGNRLCFTYGAVINTHNFDAPNSEPHKLSDLSWAYFATGNVAIDRSLLQRSGLFDPAFQLYGWEDLELGERLRRMGVVLVRCPGAVGYHWHPPLSLDQLPELVRKEQERARMGLVFYRKHPTRRVRFIIQFTFLHRLLWELLTLGGLLNENSLKPLLALLIKQGHPGVAMELLRLPLNRIGVRAMFREARQAGW